MPVRLTEAAIRDLGFAWPRHPRIAKHQQRDAGMIDLSATLAALEGSLRFHEKQITAAFNFKSQTGADYDAFTDRFDEYVATVLALKEAVAYVERILAAAEV